MSVRRRVWVHLGMAFVTAAFFAAAWMTRPYLAPLPPAFVAAKKAVPPEYADDAKCVSCHSDVAEKFAYSGMGRAFSSWKNAEPIEDRTEGPGPVLTLGNLHYQVVIDGGRMFQREFRVVDGAEVELNRREAAYVLGSGTKGRGYLASENGYLTALPISWYSSRKAWDFSPGYRHSNPRFSRPIVPACMSCHNATFGVLEGSINGYVEPLPMGLGCQRCHGPGAAHVAFQERGEHGVDPMPNIAKLEPARQMDVCLQCHLLSDDRVRRSDCGSFKPGDRLADCRVDYFDVKNSGAFDAAGHGPRTMASKCYTASGGKLTCIRCHDPHRPARDVPRTVYNQRCNECHETVPCKRPIKPTESVREGDCVSCHMPMRKADDIPHTGSTEHWIHIPGRTPGAAFPSPKDPAAKVVAWTAGSKPFEDAAAELRASLREGRTKEVRRVTERLEGYLKTTTTTSGDHWLETARGFHALGETAKARDALDQSLAVAPNDVETLDFHARFLGATGDLAGKAKVLERILRENPWYNVADVDLLDALARSGAEARAFDLYERYLQFHPPSVEALLLLGDMKRRMKAPNSEAAAYYRKAAATDGARSEPHLALARLAMLEKSYTAAAIHAHAASLRNPTDSRAWSFDALCEANAGNRSAAKVAAEKAIALDPANAEARGVLKRQETIELGKR
jgi:tetratricopeptide (TPR) repeat protein